MVQHGNYVIFHQLSPMMKQVTVNSCSATRTILNSSVPQIRNISSSSSPLFVIVATCYLFTDLERMQACVLAIYVPAVLLVFYVHTLNTMAKTIKD